MLHKFPRRGKLRVQTAVMAGAVIVAHERFGVVDPQVAAFGVEGLPHGPVGTVGVGPRNKVRNVADDVVTFALLRGGEGERAGTEVQVPQQALFDGVVGAMGEIEFNVVEARQVTVGEFALVGGH